MLLALTAGDYLLWDWSIADSHDVVSLVSGLTLLPIAAITVGMVAVAGARLLRLLLGGPSSRRPPGQAHEDVEATNRRPPADASERDSSGRLAA